MATTISLCQINPTVGALAENCDLMAAEAKAAFKDGASIIVFPELAMAGYPPEDLILKRHFAEDAWRHLQNLAGKLPPDALVILGVPQAVDTKVFNSAAILQGGRIAATYHKMILPNYGVFDEKRVFAPGKMPFIIHLGTQRIGIHICEDSWFIEEDSVQLLKEAHLDLLINLSASPYHRGKRSLRENILRKTALFLNCPLAYCNLVGGQDELVFDGGSLLMDRNGQVTARAPQFESVRLTTDLDLGTQPFLGEEPVPPLRQIVHLHPPSNNRHSRKPNPNLVSPLLDDYTEAYAALKTGLRDYVDKNGFQKIIVALSGGIDSALVATIAVDTLGADRVAGVTMPSQYTSDGTLSDAGQLARNLGIDFFNVPIEGMCSSFLSELTPLWQGLPPDVAEENLQARIRGTLVMAISNKFNWLVLTTGNKSELATGYCTLYGDMVGGFALIKDVPKTLVYELCTWRNQQSDEPVIPLSTIERPPSAELRPDQKDSDSLPPYDILDAIIERYVERDQGVDSIVAEGFDPDTVKQVSRLIDLSEYKRRQGAPGIKITPKAFGRDRRMPITNAYREWVKGAH